MTYIFTFTDSDKMGWELELVNFLYTNLATQATAQQIWVFLTTVLPYLAAGVTLLVLTLKRMWKTIFYYALAVAIGVVLKEVIALVFTRIRPYVLLDIAIEAHRSYSSFYSLHTFITTVSILFLFLVVKNKWWRIIGILAAILVGLSRIVLAQHYLTDVLFAYVLAFGIWWLARKWVEEVE